MAGVATALSISSPDSSEISFGSKRALAAGGAATVVDWTAAALPCGGSSAEAAEAAATLALATIDDCETAFCGATSACAVAAVAGLVVTLIGKDVVGAVAATNVFEVECGSGVAVAGRDV